MTSTEILKSVVEYNKAAFECFCKSLQIFEGYSEKVAGNLIANNGEPAVNPLDEWAGVFTHYKDFRNDMVQTVGKNYDQVISLLK